MMWRNTTLVPPLRLRMLVHALISNCVDYCNSILQRVAAVYLHPFQFVLNAAARLIVRKQKFDCIMLTLHDNLYWLSVDKRIELKLCLLVFKCQHQMATPYLASTCIQLSAERYSCQLWSAAHNDLLIPCTRTASYGPRSFAVSNPTCWNRLTPRLKSASLTLQQFCAWLKTTVFTWALPSWLCYYVAWTQIDTVTGFYSISNYGNYGNYGGCALGQPVRRASALVREGGTSERKERK